MITFPAYLAERLSDAITGILADSPPGYPSAAVKKEVGRLAHYLKYYFRALEIDAAKVDLEAIYKKNVPSQGAKLSASQMQAAMFDAIQLVGPMVDAKQAEIYNAISKSLKLTYELGSKDVFKQEKVKQQSFGTIQGSTEKAEKSKLQKQAQMWAENHCAQLVVGVNDTSKMALAKIIAKGIDEQLGVPGTAKLIAKAFPEFNKRRPKLIAVTELCRAYSRATFDRFVELGITHKRVVTKDPCPICLGNKAEGVIPLQQLFKGGTKGSDRRHPPFHPDCRCTLAAAVDPAGAAKLGQIVPTPAKAAPKTQKKLTVPAFAPPEQVLTFIPDKLEPTSRTWPALSDLEFVRKFEEGSTGASLWWDRNTGQKFVMKQGNNIGHITDEFVADQIYRMVGANVPDCKLYPPAAPGGRPTKLAVYIEGAIPLGQWKQTATPEAWEEMKRKIQTDFTVDSLLGNWDVVGMNFDNILVTKDGTPYRIDNGGSLRHRAQGGEKTSEQWSNDVKELRTLHDSKLAQQASQVFDSLTQLDIYDGVKRIAANSKQILSIVEDHCGKETAEKVSNRIKSLYTYVGQAPEGDCLAWYSGGSAIPDSLHGVAFSQAKLGFWKDHKNLKLPGEPATPKGVMSSGVIITESDGSLWLIEPSGHYSGAKNTFTKGKLDDGLTLQQNALKEAYEECGLQAEITSYLGDFQKSTSTARFYVGKRVGGTPLDMQWESRFVKRVTIEQARTLLNQSADRKILDALEQYLNPKVAPAPEKPEPLKPVKPSKAESSGDWVSEVEVAEIKRAKGLGKTHTVDVGDIDDLRLHIWTEKNRQGKEMTCVQFRLLESGSDKLMNRLKDSLPSGGGVVPLGFSEDHVFNLILQAAKSVNHHQSDGKVNPEKIRALLDVSSTLSDALTKGIISKQDHDYYVGLADDVAAAANSTKKGKPAKAPMVHKRGIKILSPGKDAAANRHEFDIERVPIQRNGKRWVNGEFIETSDIAVEMSSEYVFDVDGVRVRFKPYEADHSDYYALQGYVTLDVQGDVSTATIQKIRETMDTLGISNRMASLEYQEVLYLYKGINLRRDVFAGELMHAGAILKDGSITDKDKILRLKALVKDKMGLDLPDHPTKDYNPYGRLNSNNTGLRVFERWDIPPEKMEKEMKGYCLAHHSSRSTPDLLDDWLSQGGHITSTVDRIRLGINPTVGMSPDTDLRNGPAEYFYTRIKKRKDLISESAQWIFKTSTLARLDAMSFGGDWLGGQTNVWKNEVRSVAAKADIPNLKKFAQHSSNETLLKKGYYLMDDLDSILCRTQTERDKVLQVFRKHGITMFPDGRTIEEIAVLKKDFK